MIHVLHFNTFYFGHAGFEILHVLVTDLLLHLHIFDLCILIVVQVKVLLSVSFFEIQIMRVSAFEIFHFLSIQFYM